MNQNQTNFSKGYKKLGTKYTILSAIPEGCRWTKQYWNRLFPGICTSEPMQNQRMQSSEWYRIIWSLPYPHKYYL